MEEISIRIINKSDNAIPEYATEGSSGMDLRAFLESPVTIKPLERRLVPTGIFLEIPKGYEVQVRPRSGLALKHGITCLNSPGTVDSDYRGELKVILINLSDTGFVIENGDRIAQMIVCPIVKAVLDEVTELGGTERGVGGFGHSGKR